MFHKRFVSYASLTALTALIPAACQNGVYLPWSESGAHGGLGGGESFIELPFARGFQTLCTQGVHGTHSHSSTSTEFDLDLDTDNYADQEVFVPVSGIVRVHLTPNGPFGIHANIDLGNGYYIVIAHLKNVFVSDGDEVTAGQLLGFEGCTGSCTGDHVHIGLHQGDAGQTADHGVSVPTAYRAQDMSQGGAMTTLQSEDFVCGIRSEGDPQDGHTYKSSMDIALWHPNGTLVKTPDNARVYLLQDGKRRWIENQDVFWASDLSFDDVAIISSNEFDCLEAGADIVSTISLPSYGALREGDLVKETDASDVYVISDGRALPIQSWDVFLIEGFGGRPIKTVAPGTVASAVPVGNCAADVWCLDFQAVTTCGGGLDLSGGPGTGGDPGDDDVADDDDATPPPSDDDDDATPPSTDDDDSQEEPELDVLIIEVDYPLDLPMLQLTVQPVSSPTQLGDWWHPLQPSVTDGDEVTWSQMGDYGDLLGVRFNVNVDSDGDGIYDDWYCYGHYETAFLEYGVSVDISLAGGLWDEDNLLTWSPGTASQTELGCSALLWFGNVNAIPEGYVQ